MMKIIGVSLLLFGSVIALSVGIDLFQGTNVLQALYNALSPFRVMEVAELFVLFSLWHKCEQQVCWQCP